MQTDLNKLRTKIYWQKKDAVLVQNSLEVLQQTIWVCNSIPEIFDPFITHFM